MALQYSGDVQEGYASVPRYVDDETGEEFLDFHGQLGAPPPPDPMNGALAQNTYPTGKPMGALEQATSKLYAPPGPPPQRADVNPSMAPEPPLASEDPSQLMSMAPPMSSAGETPEPVTSPEPEPPRNPLAPDASAPYGYKVVQGQRARDPENIPQSVKVKGNPGEYEDARGVHIDLMGKKQDLSEQEFQLRRAELERERDNTLNQAMQARVQADEARAKEVELEQLKNEELKKIDLARQNYKSKKVDSNRLFSGSGGGVNAFAALIAAALGGWQQSRIGGSNPGVDAVNQAIDRDIADQERQRALAGENFNEAQSEYAQKIRDGMDPERAREEIRLHQLDEAKAALEHVRANTKLGYLDVEAEKMNVALEEETLKTLTGLQERIGSEVTMKHVPGRAATRGGVVPLTLKEAAEEAKLKAQMGEAYVSVDNSERVLRGESKDPKDIYWNGKLKGKAVTVDEGKQIRAKLGGADELMLKVDRLKRLASKEWSSLDPADHKMAKSLIADLHLELKNEKHYAMGVLAGPDLDMLKDVVSNPNDFWNNRSSSLKQLEMVSMNAEDSVNAVLRSQNIMQPIQRNTPNVSYVESPDDFIRE